MAGIIYDAKKIERALTPLRCRKLDKPSFVGKKIPPHDLWETAWGHQFSVPRDGVSDWLLADIIEKEVKGTKPEKWHEQ